MIFIHFNVLLSWQGKYAEAEPFYRWIKFFYSAPSYNHSSPFKSCRLCAYLRWLPTVLTLCTSEEGWRTKNELFVSALGLSSWYSQWRLATHFICMSMVQTVAMAINNRKDNLFFFAIFHLFASFSRVSLGKVSWNSAFWWKWFRTILYRWLNGGTSGCHTGGREFDSGRTSTQGLKITE